MARAQILTQVFLNSVRPADRREEYPDQKQRGLRLVVHPSGEKSWAVRYRARGVLPRKLTLGSFPTISLAEARRRTQEALGEVAKGQDPAATKRAARAAAKAERDADVDRVERVFEQFTNRYVAPNVGPGWAKEIDRIFRKHILPAIGAKRIGDVRKADIHNFLDGIVDRGSPIIANRCLAVLSKFFNWASDERDLISVSPCKGIKPPAQENSRDRVLSDEEIKFAWSAFEAVGWPFGHFGKLLLLTGARRNEIASARWSEINLEAKTLTIGKERSKNGLAHEIPLSEAAIEILESLPRIAGKPGYVFTTNGRKPVSGFSRAKVQIDAAISELEGGEAARIDPWVFHDLRRTAASRIASLGMAPHIVEAVLNHKSGTIKGVAAVYNRYSYSAEKRAALDAWARRLNEIVIGKSAANVIKFAAHK